MTVVKNIYIDQGTDFSFVEKVLDSSGNVIDTTPKEVKDFK